MKFGDLFREDDGGTPGVASNCVQGGKVAGLGGINGEPGVKKKKPKSKKTLKRGVFSTKYM
jgi:hypothetical protein